MSNAEELIEKPIIKWAFLLKDHKDTLKCLPQKTPWWVFSRRIDEWEVYLPDEQDCSPKNQFKLIEETISKMTGFAVSHGFSAVIDIEKFVTYSDTGERSVSTHLGQAIRKTDLEGLSFTEPPPIRIDFSKFAPEKLTAFSELINYWAQPDAESYTGLYKIYEWLKATDSKMLEGFEDEITLFKRTCNHSSAGMTARHAKSSTEPPKKSMTVYEARTLIRRISDRYIKSIQL